MNIQQYSLVLVQAHNASPFSKFGLQMSLSVAVQLHWSQYHAGSCSPAAVRELLILFHSFTTSDSLSTCKKETDSSEKMACTGSSVENSSSYFIGEVKSAFNEQRGQGGGRLLGKQMKTARPRRGYISQHIL